MTMRTLDGVDVAGKRVVVRVDFNVPIDDGAIQDDTRIRAALPTLRRLLDGGASLILISHLGRPKGKVDPAFSLQPVAERLSELLGQPVALATDVVGEDAKVKVARLKPGQVLLARECALRSRAKRRTTTLWRRRWPHSAICS